MENSMTLVIFTVLSQLAIGGFVTLFLIDSYKQKLSQKASLYSILAFLVISLVAIVASVFHLGQPFSAYKAILNFGQSWLSREIVFFPLFILLVLVYAFMAKTDQAKKLTGWLATVFGAVTIVSTAMIYIIPAVPAWNSAITMIAFFITALLVGPAFALLLLSVLDNKLVDLSKYLVFVALVAILVNVVQLTILNGGFPQAVESASLIMASPLFWIKMIGLLLGFVIVGLGMRKKNLYSTATLSIIFVCFIAAEFLGRVLFYSTGVPL